MNRTFCQKKIKLKYLKEKWAKRSGTMNLADILNLSISPVIHISTSFALLCWLQKNGRQVLRVWRKKWLKNMQPVKKVGSHFALPWSIANRFYELWPSKMNAFCDIISLIQLAHKNFYYKIWDFPKTAGEKFSKELSWKGKWNLYLMLTFFSSSGW